MGAADCSTCELMGYRTCDRCECPFSPGKDGRITVFGLELCSACDGRGQVGQR